MSAAAAAPAGPRALLRRIREVMAAPGAAQDRLDRIVRLIAANMVAEVCSVYLLRAGQVLELFATEGLNPEAVHHTRLRVGEGLVGRIAATAEPLALADARAHPDFAYRPETGEEAYRSLLGVPILRAGRVIGVLVVQNRTPRRYDEEEVEALETIAMVLAELVGSGALIPADELGDPGGNATLARRLAGIKLANGLAIGAAVLHQPHIVIERIVAEDPAAERRRLAAAVAALRESVAALLDAHGAGEHLEILEAYRMFTEDRGWLARINEAIGTGLTAEAAVRRVQEQTRARLGQASDPYLRERLLDLEDLETRLQLLLAGRSPRPRAEDLPPRYVLVARTLGPAELLDNPRERLCGVVLEEGSPTAHVAIVARALDIPLVGQARGALSEIADGDTVVVDGDEGAVYVRPSDDVIVAYQERIHARSARRAAYAALRELPAVTRDGVAVGLHINAGLPGETLDLEGLGADGIGLFRTELPFMLGAGIGDLAAQSGIYARVFDAAGGRPVVFRTLDIGADKRVPGLELGAEDNPALGWRSLRLLLDRPAMLRRQLRALLQAAAGRPLDVMFPMVTAVDEFHRARAILDLECERAAARGVAPPVTLRVGAMLEVPALLWQLKPVLAAVDFLSVGSNDLLQFVFACDRGNPRLVDRYDPLSPPVLKLLGGLVRACAEARVPLSLCGEMAGRPLEAMALVGLGFRTLSMAPSAVGPVKTMVRRLAVAPLADYLATLLDLPEPSVRVRLRNYAKDHKILA